MRHDTVVRSVGLLLWPVLYIVLGSFLIPAADCQAAVVLPDVRTSGPEGGQAPSISAAGRFIAGSWVAPVIPGIGVGYAYSTSAGAAWTYETGLPVDPPDSQALPPAAIAVSPGGGTYLVTDYGPLQFFRGSGTLPIQWAPPVLALPYQAPSNGFDIPAVATDYSHGYVYASVTEGSIPSQTSTVSSVRFTASLDNGSSWQAPLRLGAPYGMGSCLAVGPDGTVYLSWVDYSLQSVMFTRSMDFGATVSPAAVVSPMLDNLAMLPIGWQRRGFPLRTYPYSDNYGTAFAPNFPSLAVDRSAGPQRGTLYLVWSEYAEGTLAPISSSIPDRGNNDTFDTAQPIPLDCGVSGSTDNAHGGMDFEDYYVFDGVAGENLQLAATGSPMGLNLIVESASGTRATAVVFNLTSSLSGSNKPAYITLPRTGRYFVHAVGTALGGSYQFTLRHWTPSAGSVSRDMRDIVLVRSTDGGQSWSPRMRVNHDAPGTDQSQPNVAVDDNGRVYVAWYDRRNSADGTDVDAYACVSDDGGRTFGPDLRLSSRSSNWAATHPAFENPTLGLEIGDRIALAAGTDYAVAAWSDLRDWPNRKDVYAARIVELPTATEVVSDLTAEPAADGVRLRWLVNDARGVSALRLFRSEAGGAELALGTSDEPPTGDGRAESLDATAEPGHDYDYRLRVSTMAGVRWLGPVSVRVPARITALAWRAAWPNPFARTTRIKLAVPRAADGAVRVYDVQGKEVRTLAAGRFEPGERELAWDGLDKSGAPAAAGIYFVAASVGSENVRMRVARVP